MLWLILTWIRPQLCLLSTAVPFKSLVRSGLESPLGAKWKPSFTVNNSGLSSLRQTTWQQELNPEIQGWSKCGVQTCPPPSRVTGYLYNARPRGGVLSNHTWWFAKRFSSFSFRYIKPGPYVNTSASINNRRSLPSALGRNTKNAIVNTCLMSHIEKILGVLNQNT